MVREKVCIAICGGGIGGVALANGLSKLDNIEFDLYEAAPQIAGSGLGVGLSENAQRALSLIGPEVRATLEEAGAVPMQPTYEIYMGNGPDFGKLVLAFSKTQPTMQVERAPFLEALVSQIDPNRLHPGKKLDSISSKGSKYEMRFLDGSTALADAIIGYDGIHSIVRQYVLGADDPAAGPHFAGFYSYWTSVDIDRAKTVLGVDHIPNTQRAWYGKDGYLLYNLMSEGHKLMVAGCKPIDKPWEENAWVSQKSLQETMKDFEDWGDFGKQMAELFVDPSTGKATVISFWEHLDASTYFKGPVCISGDAAHSMLPFQGSGAGQAIEDALVLTKVLAGVESREDVEAAFAGYDHVRRPRTQEIVATSKDMALIGLGRDAEIKADYETLKSKLPTKWDHILYLDTEAHCKEAVQHMHGSVLKS